MSGANKSETLTNKTIDTSANTLTSTSTATGDLLKSNGTSFLRLGRGTGNQVLAVNSGGTDIAWTTLSSTGGIPKAAFDYLIYYSGTQFEALNGTTGAVDYTNTTDGASVLNSAMSALTTGGTVLIKGTILCRSAVVMQSLIVLRGVGEGASIKQDATQNLAVLVDSANFATLTGGGTTAGVYSVYMENLLIDGNKANNATGVTTGLRYYGYNWHIHNVHIKNCHGIGHYSEWSTSAVSPSTGTTMNSYYSNFVVNLNDSTGWQMRGPHDSQITNSTIYSNGSTGFLQEYLATKYDGSCEMTSVHIFDCPSKGIDSKGGTLRFRGLTTESITGAGSIGLQQEGSTLIGTQFESYNNAIGVQFASGGDTEIRGLYVHDNTTDGVEILKNSVDIMGYIANNATKGIVIGSGGASVAVVKINATVFGHTSAQIDFANAGNQGVSASLNLYLDSTHATAILNEANIDETKNTFVIEQIANGTALKSRKGKVMGEAQVQTSVFYKRHGQLTVGEKSPDFTGLLSGIIIAGAQTFNFDTFEGWQVDFDTSAVSGTRAGINGATANVASFACRRMNPSLKIRFKLADTTSSRFYTGFSSATAIPVSDTPLANADIGVIVGYRSSDTNYQIFSNSGAGAATVTSTGIAKDNSWDTIEIISDDANGRFTVYTTNGTTTATNIITSNIPASGDILCLYAVLENTAASSRLLRIGSTLEVKTNFIP